MSTSAPAPTPGASEYFDPFDPATFATGGGTLAGQTVTIIHAGFEYLRFKEATAEEKGAVIRLGTLRPADFATAKDIRAQLLVIYQTADGKAHPQPYGIGDKLFPSADGESFVDAQGKPAPLHEKSGTSILMSKLHNAGFDFKKLRVALADGTFKPKVSGLVNTIVELYGEDKKDEKGAILKDKKGFTKQNYYPLKVVGEGTAVVGQPAQATQPQAGVAVAPAAVQPNSGVRDKAASVILDILASSGGSVERGKLSQLTVQKLANDGDKLAVLGLVVKEEFLLQQGQGWTFDKAAGVVRLG